MRRWTALLGACLALAGCQKAVDDAQDRAGQAFDDSVQAAKDAASKRIDEEAARVRARGEDFKNAQLRKAEETLADAKAQVARMRQGMTWDDQLESWLKGALASTDESVRLQAIPAIEEAYKRFPEKRAWLSKVVSEQYDKASAEGKRNWAWLREELRGVAQPQN